MRLMMFTNLHELHVDGIGPGHGSKYCKPDWERPGHELRYAISRSVCTIHEGQSVEKPSGRLSLLGSHQRQAPRAPNLTPTSARNPVHQVSEGLSIVSHESH